MCCYPVCWYMCLGWGNLDGGIYPSCNIKGFFSVFLFLPNAYSEFGSDELGLFMAFPPGS